MVFRKSCDTSNKKVENVPIPHAAPLVHEKVMKLLAREAKGKILDAPAGEGYASEKLKNMGFEVYAADLDEQDFKVKGVQFDKIDLNKPFPYPDDFFDHVICLESIEHLENPHHLVREMSRVVKRGGKVILSTPNIMNVHARLRYFLSGYNNWMHARINLSKEEKKFDVLEQHINMVGFPELNYILAENGFAVEVVTANMSILTYPWGRWYLKPIALFLFLSAGLFIKFYGKVIKRNITLSEYLLNKDLLYGWELIVKARKVS